MRWRSADRRGDAGTATAELAVALPGFVLLLTTLMLGGSAIVAELRCLDAARIGARWAARGEPLADVHRLAAQAAPGGAAVRVSASGQVVTVAVTAPVAGRLGAGLVDGLRVMASATAPREAAVQ
jgi:TadE-like protein